MALHEQCINQVRSMIEMLKSKTFNCIKMLIFYLQLHYLNECVFVVITWKYFGPLHHAHHLLSGQAVETGQQVVSCIGLCIVVAGVHLFRLNQLQHAADGGGQKGCDTPWPVGYQSVGGAGVKLFF